MPGTRIDTDRLRDKDDNDSSTDSDDELPLELPVTMVAKSDGPKAEFTFQNSTTAEEWKISEACLPGNKWINPSNTSVAQNHRRRRQNERIEKQKEETIQLNKTYGSITRFFAPSASESHPLAFPQSQPTKAEPPEHPSENAPPELPTDLEALFTALDFSTPADRLEEDIAQLEIWIKKNKLDLNSIWGQRVDCALRLMKRQLRRVGQSRNQDLMEDSISIAYEIDKGLKFAKSMRRWREGWIEFREVPPKPMRGKHHTRTNTLFDEG